MEEQNAGRIDSVVMTIETSKIESSRTGRPELLPTGTGCGDSSVVRVDWLTARASSSMAGIDCSAVEANWSMVDTRSCSVVVVAEVCCKRHHDNSKSDLLLLLSIGDVALFAILVHFLFRARIEAPVKILIAVSSLRRGVFGKRLICSMLDEC
jgi:hypothetical protein